MRIKPHVVLSAFCLFGVLDQAPEISAQAPTHLLRRHQRQRRQPGHAGGALEDHPVRREAPTARGPRHDGQRARRHLQREGQRQRLGRPGRVHHLPQLPGETPIVDGIAHRDPVPTGDTGLFLIRTQLSGHPGLRHPQLKVTSSSQASRACRWGSTCAGPRTTSSSATTGSSHIETNYAAATGATPTASPSTAPPHGHQRPHHRRQRAGDLKLGSSESLVLNGNVRALRGDQQHGPRQQQHRHRLHRVRGHLHGAPPPASTSGPANGRRGQRHGNHLQHRFGHQPGLRQ